MKDKTRKKIIEVASELFAKYGFHKTSMDEIARTARKAKGSLYYHFASKEELFTEVVSREFEYLKSELIVIVDNDKLDPITQAKLYLLKRNEVLSKSYNYHETLKADLFERFEFIDNLRKELLEWEKVQMGRIMQRGIEKDVFVKIDKIDVVLDVFFMVLKGLEIPLFLQKRHADFGPYFGDMISLMLRAITINPGNFP